jgi:hypothetical protein
MTLFELFSERSEFTSQRYSLVKSTLIKAHGVLSKLGSISEYKSLIAQFRSGLHDHFGRFREEFSKQSSQIAFILCAAACDLGESPARGHQKFRVENAQALKAIVAEPISAIPQSTTDDTILAISAFTRASYITLHARQMLGETVSVVCADSEEVLLFMHVVLVYLHGLAFVPSTVSRIGRCMPWDKISRFVNTLR